MSDHDSKPHATAGEARRTIDVDYARLFREHGDAIIIVDEGTQSVVQANREADRLFGYGGTEWSAVGIVDLHPADREEYAQAVHRETRRDGHASRTDLPLRCKDGRRFYADIVSTRVSAASAHVQAIVIRDSSERVERHRRLLAAQEELVTMAATYRELVACTDDAVLLADFESDWFVSANAAASRLFGYDDHEWRQLRWADLHPDDQRPTAAAIRADLRGKRHSRRQAIPLRRKDGREFSADLAQNVYEAGGRRFVVGIVRDVSERVQHEADLAQSYEHLKSTQAKLLRAGKLAAVGEIASTVAHEINNPLAALRLNNEALEATIAELGTSGSRRDATARNECREILKENAQALERIQLVVRDLGSFSRIESESSELVQLNDVVEVACNFVKNEVRHRARLSMECGELPPIVGNRGRLSQLVANLLVNAAHSIREGDAEHNEIRVVTASDGQAVTVVVEDTGCGIPEELQERVFDPFFTTKPKGRGSGLGLALCVDIVQQHDGDISVESEPGRGTRFVVSLPAGGRCDADAPAEADAPSATDAVERPARILLVDDDEAFRRALKRVLAKHHVTSASGGADALKKIQQEADFDLVLCDVMMPQVDGPDFYESVRQQAPQLLDRIVFCTGSAFTRRTQRFLQTVDNPVLRKPVDMQALGQLVCEASRRAVSVGR